MQITGRGAATREHMINSALRILADEGLSSLTFARLCDVAELSSSRLITYHFSDRAGLMRAVIDRVLHDFGSSVAEQLATIPPGSGLLRAFLEANAEFMAEHRGHVMALVGALTDSGGDQAFTASEQNQAAVADVIRGEIDAGRIRNVNAEHLAFMMMRCVEGLAVAVAADPKLDPRPYATSMADLLLNGIAP